MTNPDRIELGVWIDRDLWERFKNNVEERYGYVRGNLGSELDSALEEYLRASEGGDTHDRLSRMEEQLDEIHDALLEDGATPHPSPGAVSVKKEKTASTANAGGVVQDRVRAIHAAIDEHRQEAPVVHESTVERFIEDHAGSSRPTLSRYKELLKRRHLLYEHPHPKKETWFSGEDGEEYFAQAANSVIERGIIDMIDLANEYGEKTDWLEDILDEHVKDDAVGFE